MDYDYNWRSKIGKKVKNNELTWRISLHAEYVEFLNGLNILSEIYNWNIWGGGVDNFAVTLSQRGLNCKSISICLKALDGYKYYACFDKDSNPNNINKNFYNECIGDTMEEALKYVHSFIVENKDSKDIQGERIVVFGGAYDRYPLAYFWALEERDKIIS